MSWLRGLLLLGLLATCALLGMALKPTTAGLPENFDVLLTDQGRPVVWESCAPIHYQVNLTHAPAGAVADVQEAFRRVGAASGRVFQYAGETTLAPAPGVALPAGVVVVAWATPEENSHLLPAASGNSGPEVRTTAGYRHYYAASVVLNADHSPLYRPGTGIGTTQVNLLAHEVAHTLGVGHSTHAADLMAPSLTAASPDGFSARDQQVLRLVGCPAHAE